MLRSLGQKTSHSSDSLSDLELSKVDRIIEILLSMEQDKVEQWLDTYRNKMSTAIKSGEITEARYYHAIIEKWQKKREDN